MQNTPYLKVYIVPTLKVNLDKNKSLIMLALYGFEEPPTTKNFLENNIVGRWQVMKIIFRC